MFTVYCLLCYKEFLNLLTKIYVQKLITEYGAQTWRWVKEPGSTGTDPLH